MQGPVQQSLGTQELFSPSAAGNGSRISVEVLSCPPVCAHTREPPPCRARAHGRESPPRACRCAGPVQEHGYARRARTEAGAHTSAVNRQVGARRVAADGACRRAQLLPLSC